MGMLKQAPAARDEVPGTEEATSRAFGSLEAVPQEIREGESPSTTMARQ